MDSDDVAFNNFYECLTLYITVVDRFSVAFLLELSRCSSPTNATDASGALEQ